jgi:tripeptidyl-peptidase-1
VALNDFLGESNNRSDTKVFLDRYRPNPPPSAYTLTVIPISNGNNEQTQENTTELAAGKDLEGRKP